MNDDPNAPAADLGQSTEALRSARTDLARRSALESLVRRLFESVPLFMVKHVNQKPTMGELEIIVQLDRSERNTVFDGFGRYFIVECKGWDDPAGVHDARHLAERMRKSRVKLGVILAPAGIAGKRAGGVTMREIQRTFESAGLLIVVIAAEHMELVAQGADFHEVLEYLIERRMFDLV